MIAYLSGGMEHAENDGANWRKEITQWLNDSLEHNVIDPVIESKKLITDNNAKDSFFDISKKVLPFLITDMLAELSIKIIRLLSCSPANHPGIKPLVTG